MGTNFYMMTKNEEIAHRFFIKKHYDYEDPTKVIYTEPEYKIVEYPYLGYQLHLNKLSAGWCPLFQIHRHFNTFDELKSFYSLHSTCKEPVEIFDEYGEKYNWREYEERIIRHLGQRHEPMKWIYETNDLSPTKSKILKLIPCDADEADLWTPLNHNDYMITEREAAKRFGVASSYSGPNVRYVRDPKYQIDWTEGDFS